MVFITMILAVVFIVFKALFLNMFIKLFYITGTFTHFSIIICINFLLDIFRGFFVIFRLVVCFFWSLHCSSMFLLMFFLVLICLLILMITIHHQVLLF